MWKTYSNFWRKKFQMFLPLLAQGTHVFPEKCQPGYREHILEWFVLLYKYINIEYRWKY